MKHSNKYFFSITSILLAIGLFGFSVFSTPNRSKFVIYWFKVNAAVLAGSSLNGVSISSTYLQTTNSFGCGFGALYDCAAAFPGYYYNGEVYLPARTANSSFPLSPAFYDVYVIGAPTTGSFY